MCRLLGNGSAETGPQHTTAGDRRLYDLSLVWRAHRRIRMSIWFHRRRLRTFVKHGEGSLPQSHMRRRCKIACHLIKLFSLVDLSQNINGLTLHTNRRMIYDDAVLQSEYSGDSSTILFSKRS